MTHKNYNITIASENFIDLFRQSAKYGLSNDAIADKPFVLIAGTRKTDEQSFFLKLIENENNGLSIQGITPRNTYLFMAFFATQQQAEAAKEKISQSPDFLAPAVKKFSQLSVR